MLWLEACARCSMRCSAPAPTQFLGRCCFGANQLRWPLLAALGPPRPHLPGTNPAAPFPGTCPQMHQPLLPADAEPSPGSVLAPSWIGVTSSLCRGQPRASPLQSPSGPPSHRIGSCTSRDAAPPAQPQSRRVATTRQQPGVPPCPSWAPAQHRWWVSRSLSRLFLGAGLPAYTGGGFAASLSHPHRSPNGTS